MENKHGDDGFLLGFLVGGVIGLAVGFLYAPRAGSETRTMLGDKTAQAREAASKLMVDGQQKANEIIAQARETAAELIHEGEKRVRPKRTQA